jgi:hypothetical protein
MKPTVAGEARIRGYLFVLQRSLSTFMPKELAQDSLREVESHILERLEKVDVSADEREAIEKVLRHLGPPLKVAQAYAAEIAFDEAAATGRVSPVLRALGYASTTVRGFFTGLGLFVGYTVGVGFVVLALLKPIFPQNVGLIMQDGIPRAVGAVFPLEPGMQAVGGYELIPIFLVLGSLTLGGTHALARRFVTWWRGRLKGPLDPLDEIVERGR